MKILINISIRAYISHPFNSLEWEISSYKCTYSLSIMVEKIRYKYYICKWRCIANR